jgi:hypothetical protein
VTQLALLLLAAASWAQVGTMTPPQQPGFLEERPYDLDGDPAVPGVMGERERLREERRRARAERERERLEPPFRAPDAEDAPAVPAPDEPRGTGRAGG